MDSKSIGMLCVRFNGARLISPQVIRNSGFYLTVTFGGQNYSSSTSQVVEGKVHWGDTMKFGKTIEETISIRCFMENGSGQSLKIGAAIIPISQAVNHGSYKGNVSLMDNGKITLHLLIDLAFEQKSQLPFEYPTVIYPVSPPELPHVHAYSIPANFTYTPPGYYQSQHGQDILFN